MFCRSAGPKCGKLWQTDHNSRKSSKAHWTFFGLALEHLQPYVFLFVVSVIVKPNIAQRRYKLSKRKYNIVCCFPINLGQRWVCRLPCRMLVNNERYQTWRCHKSSMVSDYESVKSIFGCRQLIEEQLFIFYFSVKTDLLKPFDCFSTITAGISSSQRDQKSQHLHRLAGTYACRFSSNVSCVQRQKRYQLHSWREKSSPVQVPHNLKIFVLFVAWHPIPQKQWRQYHFFLCEAQRFWVVSNLCVINL